MSNSDMSLLGQILIEKDYLTQSQLERVLAKKGLYEELPFGSILLRLGLVTPAQLYEALSVQGKFDKIA